MKKYSDTLFNGLGYKLVLYKPNYIKFIDKEDVIIEFKLHNGRWLSYKHRPSSEHEGIENLKYNMSEINAIVEFCNDNDMQ